MKTKEERDSLRALGNFLKQADSFDSLTMPPGTIATRASGHHLVYPDMDKIWRPECYLAAKLLFEDYLGVPTQYEMFKYYLEQMEALLAIFDEIDNLNADWTMDPEMQESNTSDLFKKMASEAHAIIKDNIPEADIDDVQTAAELIVSELAHKYKLAPR